MTWFRVDDRLRQNRKVMFIPRAQRVSAMGLWVLAGSWSSAELTDGVIPAYMVEELAGTDDVAELLVRADLWHGPGHSCTECPDPGDGYVFHDWTQCNPTREAVEAERASARDRMRARRSGGRQPNTQSGSPDVRPNTDGTSSEVHPKSGMRSGDVRDPRPDPTRPEVPDGTSQSSSAPADAGSTTTTPRGKRLPPGWEPSPALIEWTRTNAPHVRRPEVDRFRDYWAAQPGAKGRKTDWDATWRNWCRNVEDRSTANRSTTDGRVAQALSLKDTARRLDAADAASVNGLAVLALEGTH